MALDFLVGWSAKWRPKGLEMCKPLISVFSGVLCLHGPISCGVHVAAMTIVTTNGRWQYNNLHHNKNPIAGWCKQLDKGKGHADRQEQQYHELMPSCIKQTFVRQHQSCDIWGGPTILAVSRWGRSQKKHNMAPFDDKETGTVKRPEADPWKTARMSSMYIRCRLSKTAGNCECFLPKASQQEAMFNLLVRISAKIGLAFVRLLLLHVLQTYIFFKSESFIFKVTNWKIVMTCYAWLVTCYSQN